MSKISIAIFLCLLFMTFSSFAQSVKIAYADVEKLFAQWPEAKASETDLKEYENRLATRLQAKMQDLQIKIADYNKNRANMDAITRQDIETELKNLQSQVQQYEANAQVSVNQKRLSLVQPLQTKLKNTIDMTAKENGFTHVFSLNNSLIFTSDKQGDLTPLVARKLGFTLSSN